MPVACWFLLVLGGVPVGDDLLRFGPISRQEIRAMLAFNWEYQQHLHRVQCTYADSVGEELSEAEHLHRVWDKLDDAMYGYCEDLRLRGAIGLKKLIGDEAYAAGRMPPHVPFWRFRSVR